jgi:protein-L-isoaspartate(D-aspartate) O-methyltransferase
MYLQDLSLLCAPRAARVDVTSLLHLCFSPYTFFANAALPIIFSVDSLELFILCGTAMRHVFLGYYFWLSQRRASRSADSLCRTRCSGWLIPRTRARRLSACCARGIAVRIVAGKIRACMVRIMMEPRIGLGAFFLVLSLSAWACGGRQIDSEPGRDPRLEEREHMVEMQLAERGITDAGVLSAMRRLPRHLFVPEPVREYAYGDHPLPIGEGQTISQPYIVAYMTQALALQRGDRVLEIGTGSGYQTAVLAELVDSVYTIEIVETLAERAAKTLRVLGYENIHTRTGDGWVGWPEVAPFDAIIVTAAPNLVPQQLVEQLKEGGAFSCPRRG